MAQLEEVFLEVAFVIQKLYESPRIPKEFFEKTLSFGRKIK